MSRRFAIGLAAVAAIFAALPAVASAATISPNTTLDDYGSDTGLCSLREAIQSIDQGSDFGGCIANLTPDGYGTNDTVALLAGTYTLTISAAGQEDSNVEGDLDIFKNMKILGTGNPVIQQTVPGERVIDETATGKTLALSGLTIEGGTATSTRAAGIDFVGAAGAASLSLDDVTVTDNHNAGGPGAFGGGIYTDSPTTITNSVITNNTIALNSGSGDGGGMYQDAGSSAGVTLVIQNSSIVGNSAGNGGTAGSGGGIYRSTKIGDPTATATIQDTSISGNIAHDFGGGIYSQSDGALDFTRLLISGNTAQHLRGGGIAADSRTISAGHLDLVNSTVTGNTAASDGGGIMAGGITGAINMSLLFSTVAQNTGNQGSEFYFSGISSPKPQLTVEGLVVSSSTSLTNVCHDDGSGFTTFVDGGYNVSSAPTNSCGIGALPGDRTSSSIGPALVGPLADNGGTTMTMIPTAASFATDNMPGTTCAAISPSVTTDQRGYPRPDMAGGNCDSGAYESFTCNGSLLNASGPFPGCTPPGNTGNTGTTGGPQTPGTSASAKCKKKKKAKKASAAKKKKCKKKKRKK
jgi:CSLREA domain-containing protein